MPVHHRRRWTARMLKREMHPDGGGGLGMRPCLRLRIPLAAVPVEERFLDGRVFRVHEMTVPPPDWFRFDGVYGETGFWKYEDLSVSGSWLVVELSAYRDEGRSKPPLAKVAESINRASAAGVRIGIHAADRRGRRWWNNPNKQSQEERRWLRRWRAQQAKNEAAE
jgi:hypothetical protein